MVKKNNKKGFSLIEMIAVIAIVAVLVSVIMPTVSKSGLQSRAATNAANLRSVEGYLSSLRVSNYNAFMTAADLIKTGTGGHSEESKDRLNGWVPGLGDALSKSLATLKAENGEVTLPMAPDITVAAPIAKEVKAAGENGEVYVTKTTEMEIYILDNQIICMYDGYTKEDFSDIAEDGVYDGGGIEMSDGEKLLGAAECLLKYGSHDFGDGDRKTCSRCTAANPDYCEHTDTTMAGGYISGSDGFCDKCGNYIGGGDSGEGDGETPTTGSDTPTEGEGEGEEEESTPTTPTFPDICVTPDTLVTLANGTQKRIGDLNYGDKLKVWDFYTASYTTAPVALIIDHGEAEYEIIELIFADGTKLNFVGCHGAFNATRNEFVDIDASNVASFVGNAFVKLNGSGYGITKLVDYNVKTERNGSITLLTGKHHNAILNGMLTISPSTEYAENLYEPFAVGSNMQYDLAKMQKDIATYGQYTYEEFSQYVTREQFDMWGIANMKITVGKGYTTYENIVAMLNMFAIPNA